MLIWINKLLGRVEEKVVKTSHTKSQKGKRKKAPLFTRELVCVGVPDIKTRLASNSGAISKIGLILVAFVFMMSVFIPIMFATGMLSLMAAMVFKIPGVVEVFKVLTGLYCSLRGAVEEVTKGVKAATGGIGKLAKGIKDKAMDVVGYASDGIKVIPLVGEPLGGMVNWGGKVITSPLLVVEKVGDLAKFGSDAILGLNKIICGFHEILKQLEQSGQTDAYRKALSCANWDADRYGSLKDKTNLTKDGKPKFCIPGNDDGDKKNHFIPPWLLSIYQKAGHDYEVPWELLAAINLNDTNLGAHSWNKLEEGGFGRIGWIPFTKDEWLGNSTTKSAYVDAGSVAPNFYGSPYDKEGGFYTVPVDKKDPAYNPKKPFKQVKVKPQQCPTPLDTKGEPWTGGIGKLTEEDVEANTEEADLGDYKGGKLTAKQVGQILIQVGFPKEEIYPGIVAAYLESGFDPSVKYEGPANSDAAGLYQILRSTHRGLLERFGGGKKEAWKDPIVSAKVALELYKGALKGAPKFGWQPWQAMPNGVQSNWNSIPTSKKNKAMSEAEKAAEELGMPITPQSEWGKSASYGKGGGINITSEQSEGRKVLLQDLKPSLKQHVEDQKYLSGYTITSQTGKSIASFRFKSGPGSDKVTFRTLSKTVQGYKITISQDNKAPEVTSRKLINFIERQVSSALTMGGVNESGNVSTGNFKPPADNGAYTLTKTQEEFAFVVASLTKVDINVIRAQMFAEQGGKGGPAEKNYEKRKYYNYLNIAEFDNGPGAYTKSSVWKDPKTAAKETADFILGKKGGASKGIVDAYEKGVEQTKQKKQKDFMLGIANSGWATSKYRQGSQPPGTDLFIIYEKLKKLDQPDSSNSEENSGVFKVQFEPDGLYDTCDPVDGIFALANWLSKQGAKGWIWKEAYPTAKEIEQARKETAVTETSSDAAQGNGTLEAFIRGADKLDGYNATYTWGGGHGGAQPVTDERAKQGLDCSGTVGYVLQQAGVKVDVLFSDHYGEALKQKGWKSGEGKGAEDITVYYDPSHTLMKIGNKYFGTSGGSGGMETGRRGPQWLKTPSPGYLSRFKTVHITTTSDGSSDEEESSSSDPNAGYSSHLAEFNKSAAESAVNSLETDLAGFAVSDSNGNILYSHDGTKKGNSASVVKTLFAVALSQKYQEGIIPANIKEATSDMIVSSNNGASNTVLQHVGAARVTKAAQDAGMKNFELKLSADCPLEGANLENSSNCFAAGSSNVSAEDVAKLFARFNSLIDTKHHEFFGQMFMVGDSEGKIGGIEGSSQSEVFDYGIYKSKLADTFTHRKSGWRPEGKEDWTLNQGARIKTGTKIWGVSFVTRGGMKFKEQAKVIQSVMDKSFPAPKEEAAKKPSNNGNLVPACFADKVKKKKFGEVSELIKTNKGAELLLDTCLGEIEPLSSVYCSVEESPQHKNTKQAMAIYSASASSLYKLSNPMWVRGMIEIASANSCEMPNDDKSAGWAGISVKDWKRFGTNTTGTRKRGNQAIRGDKFRSTDAVFALTRALAHEGIKKDPNKWEAADAKFMKGLVKDYFDRNGGNGKLKADIVEKYVNKVEKYDSKDIVQSQIGKAVQIRNHKIDRSLTLGDNVPCENDTVYAECIAKLYKIIVLEYYKSPPGKKDEDLTSGSIPGGCGKFEGDKVEISDVPDLKIKPYSSKRDNIVLTKEKDKVYTTDRPTYGREDAMKATVAVIQAFQSCYPEFKSKWKDIRVNDWGSQLIADRYGLPGGNGHNTHRNGAHNDFTILNVTSYELPGQKYDREKALVLASLFFRAGAHWIFFDDPELQEFFIENRAKEAKRKPELKNKYKAWFDTPMLWAYGGIPGDAGALAQNSLHHNHFHVRWNFGGENNTANPEVEVYMSDKVEGLEEGEEGSGPADIGGSSE